MQDPKDIPQGKAHLYSQRLREHHLFTTWKLDIFMSTP